MDDTDLREFVDHGVHLGSSLFGGLLVCRIPDSADRVPRRLRIILIMQSAPFALAIGFFC